MLRQAHNRNSASPDSISHAIRQGSALQPTGGYAPRTALASHLAIPFTFVVGRAFDVSIRHIPTKPISAAKRVPNEQTRLSLRETKKRSRDTKRAIVELASNSDGTAVHSYVCLLGGEFFETGNPEALVVRHYVAHDEVVERQGVEACCLSRSFSEHD